MDLSYEAQLIELRRRLTDDAQMLEERGLATGDSSVSRDLFAKAAYATTALRYMDELDRTGLVEPL